MRRSSATSLLGLIFAFASLVAFGLEVPGIGGHMTDPQHKLSDGDKTSIEDRLSKIQEDTHIDVAGWISDVPDDQGTAYGEQAFKNWGIGHDWDNGVFLLFPGTGRVHVIQDHDKPMLTAEEAAKLASEDRPDDDLRRRIERLADKAREMLEPKTQNKTRPWGTAHPDRGLVYAVFTGLIALLGVGISAVRWRDQRAAQPPTLDTDQATR